MDSATGPPSEFSRVRRLPARASYDKATIHGILDAAMIGHVGVVRQGRPVVIPMLFGRVGDELYLHGSVASQLLRGISDGLDLCFTTTLIDELVFARSAFHHSMNYRSVMLLGSAARVRGAAGERAAVAALLDHMAPGRSTDARPPTDAERRATLILRFPIEEGSAKVRTGGPIEEPDDLALAVWAGVLPFELTPGEPVPEPDLADGVATPSYVARPRRRR